MTSVGVESSKWSARDAEVTPTDHKILIQLESIPIGARPHFRGFRSAHIPIQWRIRHAMLRSARRREISLAHGNF